MPRLPILRLSATLLIAGTTACQFQPHVAPTALVSCRPGVACPTGTTCVTTINRCISAADRNGPVAEVLAAQVQPSRGTPHTSFATTFTVTQALFSSPQVAAQGVDAHSGAAVSLPFSCPSCEPGATCTCTLAIPSPAPSDGTYGVEVTVTDAVGNVVGPISAGSFTLDSIAPALLGPATMSFVPSSTVTTPATELGPLTGARICFQVDEPLGSAPALSSTPPGLVFAQEAGFPTSDERYCFDATLDGGVPDGQAEVAAELVDLVGNAAQVEIVAVDAGLVLKSTPPPSPNLDPDGGLFLHRAPWGEPPQFGAPVEELRSGAFGIGEAGYLRVYGDRAGTQLLGEAAVSPGALTPLPLSATSVPDVWVEAVDRAGNRSPGGPQKVVEGEWVATLGGKVAGDLSSNPHRCFGRLAQVGTLTQPDDPLVELGAENGPANPGAQPIAGGAAWKQRRPNVTLGAWTEPAFAENTALQQELIPFAGDLGDQLWSWDGRDLNPLFDSSRGGPSPRGGAVTAYDSTTGKMVVFGGWDPASGAALCDLWSWDGEGWQAGPTCALPPLPDGGGVPTPRGEGTMVYDPIRKQLVMLGGNDDNSVWFNDLWILRGRNWTSLGDLGPAGPPTAFGSAAFQPTSANDGVIVLNAGHPVTDGGFVYYTNSEIWTGTWNDGGYTWAKIIPDDLCAVCNTPILMPYPGGVDEYDTDWYALTGLDGGRQLVRNLSNDPVLGALNGDGGLANVWAWIVPGRSPRVLQFILPTAVAECPINGACRVLHQGADPLPDPRGVGNLAFGPQSQALLFGGFVEGDAGALTGPALWTGNDWQRLDAFVGPGARQAAGLAFDPLTGRYLLAGGADSDLGIIRGDVWAFDLDGGWVELSGNAFGDAGVASRALVNVEGDGFLLFGDTTPVFQVPDTPGVAVVVGPTPPFFGYGAFDTSRNRAVLQDDTFFGDPNLGAIAEWEPHSGQWQIVSPPGLPNGDPVIYDVGAQRTLFPLGQSSSTNEQPLVSSWDGTTFAGVPSTGPYGGVPVARENASGAYDPASGTSLLFSGDDFALAFTDTWELALAQVRPALVCRFDVSAAALDPGATLDEVAIDATAGATGGSELDLWSGGAFAAVSTCGAGGDGGCTLAAPGHLSYQGVAPPGLVSDLDEIGVAISPLAPNGAGYSQVQVPSLAVTVRYRLP